MGVVVVLTNYSGTVRHVVDHDDRANSRKLEGGFEILGVAAIESTHKTSAQERVTRAGLNDIGHHI
jgi:hypothetical protein